MERLGAVLETSWSRLGAADAVAAAAAASDAACVGVPAALGRSWTAPAPLLGALVTSKCFKFFEAAGADCEREFIIV